MDKATQEAISSLEAIYQHKFDRERHIRIEQLTELSAHVNLSTAAQFNGYAMMVGKIYAEFFQRVLDQTLDQLALMLKESGRREGDHFWDTINAKLTEIIDKERVALGNEAMSWAAQKNKSSANLAANRFRQFGDQAQTYIILRIRELKLMSRFVVAKSASDRRANKIPDVAVMMWFPDAKENPEMAASAQNKYQILTEAVHEASNGMAKINKINADDLVPKERISSSVEEWLAKSLLVICDLDGNRQNVYYEFGYARAMGTQVLATCPKGQEPSFHLAQWSMDFYEDLGELKAKILPKISSALKNHDLSGSM